VQPRPMRSQCPHLNLLVSYGKNPIL
jgi:hypothetical protein